MASANNKGRLINFITGIQGVSTGGVAVINFQTNIRAHRCAFQLTGIAYNIDGSLVAAPNTALGSGSGAVLVPVVQAGVITAVQISNGGSGFTNATYTATSVATSGIKFTDSNGTGAYATVVVSGGAIASITVVNGGVSTNVDPSYGLTANKISVNGVILRDITPASAIAIAKFNGSKPSAGEYPVYFTEPWRNHLQQRTAMSWDLFGQSTFQMQISISTGISQPSLSGVIEFDYQRNVHTTVDASGKTVQSYFLNPVSQHQFNVNGISGRNDINTLPFSYPISRIFISGAAAGYITQVECYQDQNKVVEATVAQLAQTLQDYNFAVEASETFPTGTITNPFDTALVFDVTGRSEEALKVLNALNVRVYQSTAQNITFIMETLPGAYAA